MSGTMAEKVWRDHIVSKGADGAPDAPGADPDLPDPGADPRTGPGLPGADNVLHTASDRSGADPDPRP